MDRPLLAYDADCGPCVAFKRLVQLLDVRRGIRFVSLTGADSLGWLDAIPYKARYSSFHLVLADGRAFSGADAIPTLAAELPFGSLSVRLLTSVPGALAATRFLYSVLARLHGVGSCRGASRTLPLDTPH